MKKWKDKQGKIKLHQIRTPKSYDGTLAELEKYMEFLEIPREAWAMQHDNTGKVGLAFKQEGVHYLIVSEKQTLSKPKGKVSIKDNARAILHIMQARVLEMRKGVETVESAFGGFVDWRTTPKFPARMKSELEFRGMKTMLPLPHHREIEGAILP